MKLDENGNKLWSVSHAGPAGTNDKGLSMDIAADGGIYVGGYATGYSATSDYFLAKYQQAPIVGITDPAHDKSVTIYPNPVERVIFIRTDKGLIGNQYFVYDVQGKVILKGVFKENRLSVKDLANGLYTLSIPAEKINQPFIKK
jgi:hypothetical protein